VRRYRSSVDKARHLGGGDAPVRENFGYDLAYGFAGIGARRRYLGDPDRAVGPTSDDVCERAACVHTDRVSDPAHRRFPWVLEFDSEASVRSRKATTASTAQAPSSVTITGLRSMLSSSSPHATASRDIAMSAVASSAFARG